MIADPDPHPRDIETTCPTGLVAPSRHGTGTWSVKAVIDKMYASLPGTIDTSPVASPHCGARWVNEGDELELLWLCLLEPGHDGAHSVDPLSAVVPDEPVSEIAPKPTPRKRAPRKVTPIKVDAQPEPAAE
jgi:hypothetical protein